METVDILTSPDFTVSSYLRPSKDDKPSIQKFDDKTIQTALDWAHNAMRVIIHPGYANIVDLEDDWVKFNEQIKKHRRESDWKALELFGLTNKDLYDRQKAIFMNRDLEDKGGLENITNDIPGTEERYSGMNVVESAIDLDAIGQNTTIPKYTEEDIEAAKEWSLSSGYTIITPTRTLDELEALWDAFNGMILYHRRMSDWKCQEIFGVTNMRFYDYLKNQFIKEDLEDEESSHIGNLVESGYIVPSYYKQMANYLKTAAKTEPFVEIAKCLLEAAAPRKNIVEELLTNNLVSDVLDTVECQANNPEIVNGDLPMLTPEDMIDAGVFSPSPKDNFYGVSPDNLYIDEGKNISTKQWFEMYTNACNGCDSGLENLSSDWINKVRTLTFGLKRMIESGADEESINARKQSILELGWVPEIEFDTNIYNISRKNTALNIMEARANDYEVVDLTGFYSPNLSIRESEIQYDGLYPVFVILSEGLEWFSEIIKKVTDSTYSHCLIATDSSLKETYSYDIPDGIKGRFTAADIKAIGEPEARIRVYAFFTGSETFNKIKGLIRVFKDNVEKTSYSYANLVTYLFHKPFKNGNWSMVCSQFVDTILKSAGIDITKRDSSLVSPKDMNFICAKNKRIYKVYDGLRRDYNGARVDNVIKSIRSGVKALKEVSSIYYLNEATYIRGFIDNIHDIASLMDMRKHSYLVTNESAKRVIDSVYDKLVVKPIKILSFPERFAEDGNTIIDSINDGSIDVMSEINRSISDYKYYRSHNILEGMKYTTAKFMCILNNCNIDPGLCTKLTEEVHEHNSTITALDETYDFDEYYSESKFNINLTKRPSLDRINSLIEQYFDPI